MHTLDAILYDFHILLHIIIIKKNMTMVILTMASVQEQGENEQKNKSLMLYIAPAHQDRLHDSTLLKPVLL